MIEVIKEGNVPKQNITCPTCKSELCYVADKDEQVVINPFDFDMWSKYITRPVCGKNVITYSVNYSSIERFMKGG